MKYWAKLNAENIVEQVIVLSDEKKKPKDWLMKRFGGTWIQTFSLRGVDEGSDQVRYFRPATPGSKFDEEKQAFIPKKQFDSWVLNPKSLDWDAPTPKPDDSKNYTWDEDSLSWVEVVEETE